MRIAIVGTGGVAQRHLRALAQVSPPVQVVAHVSSQLARARGQAARWGGQAFTDTDDMLRQAQPQAVWICVTPDRHGPPESALIEHEVPFFVEKPLALDLPLPETLARRITSRALVVGVGYKFRALDTLARVRQLLAETPARMALGAWHDAMPPPPWWRQAAGGGGQVVEQATHLVDLMRLFLGRGEVLSAMAGHWPRADAVDAEVPDVTAALLRFGDVPAVLTTTDLLRGRQAIHLQLICEGRVLTLTEERLLIETGRACEEVASAVDPFAQEDIAFLQAVRERDPTRVLCSYADALETHRLCCAIRERAELPGRPAAVDGQGDAGDHVSRRRG